MAILLSALAMDWQGLPVRCHFTATADALDLKAPDEGWVGSPAPMYTVPPNTKVVEVTATPDSDDHWKKTLTFSVSSNGDITIDPQSKSFVWLAKMRNPKTQTVVTLAAFKLSQFREVTDTAVKLLNDAPKTRSVWKESKRKFVEEDAQEVANHNRTYGMSPPNEWPPKTWNLEGIPHVDFLDVVSPLQSSGALKFAPAPSSLGTVLNVDSLVLERAGKFQVPKYFAVTWPRTIAPDPNAIRPTPFLLFIRQLNRYNYATTGVFVGPELKPYPESFDYADTGMFESLHYAGPTPTSRPPPVRARSPLWFPSPKGVPYQAARAGANVVCVFPCNKFAMKDKDDPEYGVLNDPEETERTLLELQAFMFWRGSVESPPRTIGNTAVATFSSGNFFLNNWLKDATKRNGHFMSDVVRALYFFEPIATYPDPKTRTAVQFLDGLIDSALRWSDEHNDKRIRFYLQYWWPSLQRLVDTRLTTPPFFAKPSGTANKRTVSVTTNATWTKTVGRASSQPLEWAHVHHLIAATMLTHALAQGDF